MAEEFDINEEYEKIFGVTTRETLFSADDEEYNALRQEIIDAQREYNTKKTLPFEGVKLLAYEDFKRDEVVREAKKQGNRIFYIKKYRGSKLVIYGAGYFNPKDSKFHILRNCFFEDTAYFNNLYNKLYITKKLSFINSFRRDKGTMWEKKLHVYDTASLAASYYLGKKTTFREWKDERGKTLDAYYKRYKLSNIDELEDMSFPDYVPPAAPESEEPYIFVNTITEYGIDPQKVVPKKDEPKKVEPKKSQPKINIFDIADSLLQRQNNASVNKSDYPDKHLFHIIEEGCCKAWGYYEPETNFFYICKGSLVAKNEDSEYVGTTSSKTRARFIDKACLDRNDSYRVVKKDAKCRTASAAACYALGRTVTYTEWIDDNGKFLKDFYPQHFFIAGKAKAEPQKEEKPEDHLFYLKQNPGSGRTCDAKGWFDPVKNYFTIKAGSVISKEIAPQYKGTNFEWSRRLFVQRHCTLVDGKLTVKKDVTLSSPTMAAGHVTGREVKNRTIWTDDQGKTINDIYGMK